MSIVIKEIIVKTTVEKKSTERPSHEMLRNLKASIIRELKQEKTLHKTVKKER